MHKQSRWSGCLIIADWALSVLGALVSDKRILLQGLSETATDNGDNIKITVNFIPVHVDS